jgi:hypothetical protein
MTRPPRIQIAHIQIARTQIAHIQIGGGGTIFRARAAYPIGHRV